MRVAVLHGKDGYLLAEHLKRMRGALAERFGGYEEFTFDGANASLATVLDELRSWGLVQSHKLVVLNNADAFLGAEERRRGMERYVESPMADATLVMRASTWRPGNLDRMIEAIGGGIVKCEAPNDEKAEEFCIRRASKQHGVPIDADAAELLVERVGTDLARLDSELGKLAVTVCDGSDPRITRQDVAAMVGRTREEQAWAIQDALASGQADLALRKLHELLEISEAEEVLVVWSTVELVRKLHDASRLLEQGMSQQGVSAALKLWGPSTGAILRLAKALPPTDCARLLDAALGIDLNVRRGVTRDLPRRLQGFVVELTDTLPR